MKRIPILYMELTQTWQNPLFRFATIKKNRFVECNYKPHSGRKFTAEWREKSI